MKKSLRRIAGLAAATAGIAGAVLSVLAVVQTWQTANRLKREIPRAIGELEGFVDSIHHQGTAAVGLLGTARERAASIGASIEELSSGADQRPVTASILETLDEGVGQRLQSAEEFVLSMQISMRSMSSALLVLDSLPFFAPRIDPVGGPKERQLRSVAGSLTDTADLLDQVSRGIVRLRSEEAVTPAQLAQIKETLNQIDGRLALVQSEIRELSSRVERAGANLAAVKNDAERWINKSAVLTTVFFVCFGASQLSLLLHGWRGLR